ncbi:MAG: hypothetical protein IH969_08290 [Candidatus Krumholzibacteriota bacterium]|nr:hypothetical protein [Candidatus Krumholzibacteriota bacterium]
MIRHDERWQIVAELFFCLRDQLTHLGEAFHVASEENHAGDVMKLEVLLLVRPQCHLFQGDHFLALHLTHKMKAHVRSENIVELAHCVQYRLSRLVPG